ncbi:MAG: N-acetylgalactosamine 6-sulfate sulfatase [Flavobacteriales bacterium]|nr:MAG: N-acetylgalactosamine 6-sulfate sulfatase [Flavobacteriales bacterium]
MNLFQGLKIWGMILLFVVSCKKAIKEEVALTGTKPNIILIMADDQGWGDLSGSGNTNLKTPNIDAIAHNGVSFENFFVQPVCSPTRAELLTGRHFPRLGVYETSAGGERMNLGETTLADIFKEAGYKTAAYGKWHNGMQPPYHPNARGFDDYYGFASGHWGNYFSPMLEHNGEIVQGTGYLADDLTDHSIEFMEKNQKNPFLLYLPFNTPHSPMQVPDAYWNRFKDKELIQKYQGPEPENENFTRAALAMVENIDYNVGRVMAKLKQLHLEENTIVIYLSDNGPNGWRYNGGMRGKKGSTDEGGVRTPFFVQWKNTLPKGKIVTPIATALDILPTLSHLAGIAVKTEHPIDGMDLTPLLFEDDPTWKDRLIFNHWNGSTSIRTQDYRLDAQDRLYDMVKDHGQMHNISAEYPQLTDSLKTAKASWLSAVMPIEKDDRPFTLGDPDFEFTQLPARDAVPHGNIARSNRFPNDTYFTNWISTDDFITWDLEVLADGEFEVQLYYACAPSDVGTTLSLSHGPSRLTAKVTQANDAPLKGMENDRDPRMESYIKDFKPMTLGKIALKKGRASLALQAMTIPGEAAPEFRLLLFKRLR